MEAFVFNIINYPLLHYYFLRGANIEGLVIRKSIYWLKRQMIYLLQIFIMWVEYLLPEKKEEAVFKPFVFIWTGALKLHRDLECCAKSQSGTLVTKGQQMQPKIHEKLIFHVAWQFVTCKHSSFIQLCIGRHKEREDVGRMYFKLSKTGSIDVNWIFRHIAIIRKST